MKAYKWLYEGAQDGGTELTWPTPSATPADWVRMRKRFGGKPLSSATDLTHLAVDVHPELWEVELEDAERQGNVLLAKRGRLIRRVDEWTEEVAQEFAGFCLERGRLCAVDALDAAEEVWSAEKVRGIIEAEASRDFMERAKQPTSFDSVFGPPPPLKPEGMDMVTSQMLGNPRLAPQLEAEFDRYAGAYGRSGVFYSALTTVEGVLLSQRLREEEQEGTGVAQAARRAAGVADASKRAYRNAALTELFKRFARAETSSAPWFSVMDRAWETELVSQSEWLAKRMNLTPG